MADSWINWSDFVGANEEQLAAQDQRVAASQEAQRAAMEAALARLGSDYDAEAGDVEADYQRRTEALYDPTSTYNNPTTAGMSTVSPVQGGRMEAASGSPYTGLGATGGVRVTGTQGGADTGSGNLQRTDQRSADSYAALMQAQNDAEMNAFKGFQSASASAPAWQNALYGQRTQYEDPWAGLQEKVDPLKARNEERQTRARTAYETALADRKTQAQTTTKPTGTDVDGNPTYGTQVDTGPRNQPIKPPAVTKVRAY